jgi:hypothetical protein
MAPGVPQRIVPPFLSWQVGAANDAGEERSTAIATEAKIRGRMGAAFSGHEPRPIISNNSLYVRFPKEFAFACKLVHPGIKTP